MGLRSVGCQDDVGWMESLELQRACEILILCELKWVEHLVGYSKKA